MKKALLFILISFILISLIIIPLPTKIFANGSSCTLNVTPAMAGLETTFDMHFENCQTYTYNLDYGYDAVVGVINNSPENISKKQIFSFPGQYTADLIVFIDANIGVSLLYNSNEDTLICQETVTFTVPENPDIGMNITPGYSTVIELLNNLENIEHYTLIVFKFCGSIEELFSLSEEEIEDRIILFEEDIAGDPDGKVYNLSLSDGGYIALFGASGPGIEAIDIEYFKVGTGCGDSTDESIEPVWVRNVDMTCYQVWINEDNSFEFVFWWEYRDNNWVKIYDMAGNEVFSIDMPYGDAHFIANLPDGMYTVKTFHDQPEQLQTFIIGKP